jgi:hypothetical protein
MPKTNADEARELAKNSSDCSFLLTHLIRQNDGRTDAEASGIIQSILDIHSATSKPNLRAAIIGWYGTCSSPYVFNPSTGKLDGIVRNRAVCFTESTLSGLRAHRDLFKVKYGLAFDRDYLFSKGANPCLNIRESLLRAKTTFTDNPQERHLYNFIPSDLQPFVNVIHESFDATHEREWRYANDFNFNWRDLRFVFCPEQEFNAFSKVQNNSIPCLFDLAWLDRV